MRLLRTPVGRALKRLFWRPIAHEYSLSYQAWLQERIAERSRLSEAVARPGLISFLTCAWNTDPRFINQLAQSVLGQKVSHSFEWIILDNGSTRNETKACLSELGGHARVRLFRADKNLGIVGGMRHCLERASGKYVLPLDSDDRLYPDCLSVLAEYLPKHGYPSLAYSDEDLLRGNSAMLPYHKPDWDPVLFLDSCYIAHLCAIDREKALALGVYTDPGAEGCHDWDTFMRFIRAGYIPAHVPEILYSWRMHEGSCAGNIDSKSYIHSSHRHVLGSFLESLPKGDRFSVEPSPLFKGTPDWRIQRKRINPRPIISVVLCHDPEDFDSGARFRNFDFPDHAHVAIPWYAGAGKLKEIADSQRKRGALIHLILEDIELSSDEWAWEAIGLLEIHPDAVMVGGRVLNERNLVVSAGEYFGFGGVLGCPDLGRTSYDPGYFAQMFKHRSVSSVPAIFSVIDADFLSDLLNQEYAPAISIPFLGAWAGALAARTGKRIIYSPFLTAKSRTRWEMMTGKEEKAAFLRLNRDLIPETRFLSRTLSLDPSNPYASSTEIQRQKLLDNLLAGFSET